jgi:alkanesulfonate monooxygenase SsuD/methylene tetrahydromethanopterin reductase-like flavin-dependent oxidoreductase (luciferase family)
MAHARIGIGLPNQVRNVNPSVIPRWSVQAEEAGFSTLGTVGRHAYPSVADTVALTAAAAVTSRIELMSTVLLAATWPATLLAKELAGIDGISGNRLTLGIGSGGRPDDFLPPEYGMRGRGERLDRDLETFRDVWRGEPFNGGTNPALSATHSRTPAICFPALSSCPKCVLHQHLPGKPGYRLTGLAGTPSTLCSPRPAAPA